MAVLLGNIKRTFRAISTKTGKFVKIEPNIINDIKEFSEYCYSFYDKNRADSIYPIATKKIIDKAIYIYLISPKSYEVHFDSFDREKVREIIGK